MYAAITLDRNMTPMQRARASMARLRNPKVTPGSHVSDLVALRKAVMLCQFCEPKFGAKAHGYAVPANFRGVNTEGPCDGCKRETETGRLYLHTESLPS